MSSGKQVLLHLLEKYSQKLQADEDLDEVSEDLRVALLLHGSTPDDMWFNVERVSWLSKGEDEDVSRQGLGIKGKNIFLSDIFESMSYKAGLFDNVKDDFPNLTEAEYLSALQIIWLIITATEWFSGYESIENDGKLDFEQMEIYLKSYKKKMKLFRDNPGDFLGYEDKSLLQEYKKILEDIGKING